MTQSEFHDALDRWGGDLGRWPMPEARGARLLLAQRADLRRDLEAARLIDVHLESLTAHEVSPALANRILANLPAADRLERLLTWLTSAVWKPAVLAMLVAGMGYLAGTASVAPVDTELATDVISLAFNDLYTELDDGQQ